MTKEEKLQAIHQEALTEFDEIQSAVRDERLQCLKDRRFCSIPGAQWEGSLGEQFENKPRFEVNKVHLSVIRIINEYRNNRITVNFVSRTGESSDTLAETCDGLYRADEKDSGAEEAYDNGFEEAVTGGFGAWRLRAAYEDEEDDEDERQRINIEPIFDADSSVFFDLNAKRQDKADAKSCFVLTSMSPSAYENEYEDNPVSWSKEIHQCEFDWSTPDVVFVAEYYKVEEIKETIHIWESVTGEEERYKDADFEADPELEARLTATGGYKVRQKKVRRQRVHKYILSGGKVLEDCGYIAGKHIPVVVVYGKRWFVDNIERCMGHTRLAVDAQRLKNMLISKFGELSALSSTEKPIVTPEQISGHALMWAEDNIKNYPYLLLNPVTDVNGNPVAMGPIGYTKPPQIPPALAALMQITEQDIQDLLGNQQAGEKLEPNISGKAVELIQTRLDMQTFIYMSNMSKAIKRSGEVWLSMAKELFTESGRKMKSVGGQGEVQSIELSKLMMDKDGATRTENNLAEADFDVTVDVGPSSSSKRSSTVKALMGMASITDDPETKQVLGAMTMMNMEGEGIAEVRDYFRQKLLRMGVVKPTEDEKKVLMEEMQNVKPDPNAEYLKAAAEAEMAKAAKARSDTVLTIAKSGESKANTMKILSDIDGEEVKRALDVADNMDRMGV